LFGIGVVRRKIRNGAPEDLRGIAMQIFAKPLLTPETSVTLHHDFRMVIAGGVFQPLMASMSFLVTW
jgi:hypothetical protein